MGAPREDNKPSGGRGSSIGEIFFFGGGGIFLRRVTPVLNPKMLRSYLGKRDFRAGSTAQRLKGLDGAIQRELQVIPQSWSIV